MKRKQPLLDAIDPPKNDKPAKKAGDLRKFSKAEAKVNEAVAILAAISVTDSNSCNRMLSALSDGKQVADLIEAKRVQLVKPLNDEVKKINDYAKRTLLAKLELEIDTGKKKVVSWQLAEEKRISEARTADRILQLEALGFVAIERGAYEVPGVSLFGAGMISETGDADWKNLIDFAIAGINRRTDQTLADHKADLELAQSFGSEDQKGDIQNKIDDLEEEQQARNAGYAALPAGSWGGHSTTPETIKGLTKRWTFEIIDWTKVPIAYLQLDEKKIREAIAGPNGMRDIAGLRIYQDTSISIR